MVDKLIRKLPSGFMEWERRKWVTTPHTAMRQAGDFAPKYDKGGEVVGHFYALPFDIERHGMFGVELQEDMVVFRVHRDGKPTTILELSKEEVVGLTQILSNWVKGS